MRRVMSSIMAVWMHASAGGNIVLNIRPCACSLYSRPVWARRSGDSADRQILGRETQSANFSGVFAKASPNLHRCLVVY